MSAIPVDELRSLAQLSDYRVAADDPDPRDWTVIDANDVEVGRVADLIIDVTALVARYIECTITRGNARRVLIPTGFARLEKADSVVHLDYVTAADIEQLPTFNGLPIDPRDVQRAEEVLTGVANVTSATAKIVRRADVAE
jgi:hypothetical protein